MEHRRLLATFTVMQVGDDGAGSFRQAIRDANNRQGTDLIDFRIVSGERTIAPASPLPEITDPVVIDGTQPGHAGVPMIELSGSGNPDPDFNGLKISAGGSTVRGLVINRFGGHGLVLMGKGNNGRVLTP